MRESTVLLSPSPPPWMDAAERGWIELRECRGLLADLHHNCKTKAETAHLCTQLHLVRFPMGHICFLGPTMMWK